MTGISTRDITPQKYIKIAVQKYQWCPYGWLACFTTAYSLKKTHLKSSDQSLEFCRIGVVDLLGTYFTIYISIFGQHDLPPPEFTGSSQGPHEGNLSRETGAFRRPEPCFGSMMKRNVYFNTWMFPWPGDQWY